MVPYNRALHVAALPTALAVWQPFFEDVTWWGLGTEHHEHCVAALLSICYRKRQALQEFVLEVCMLCKFAGVLLI